MDKTLVRVVLGSIALILVGCESDAHKLERLQAAVAVSSAQVDSARATAVRASYVNTIARDTTDLGVGFHPSKQHLDSLQALARLAEDRFHAANIRQELAQRELAKFMSGR